ATSLARRARCCRRARTAPRCSRSPEQRARVARRSVRATALLARRAPRHDGSRPLPHEGSAVLLELGERPIEHRRLAAHFRQENERRDDGDQENRARDGDRRDDSMRVPEREDDDEREQKQTDSGRKQRDHRVDHDLRDAMDLLLKLRREELEPRLRYTNCRRQQLRERGEQPGDRAACGLARVLRLNVGVVLHADQRRLMSKPINKPAPAAIATACHGLPRTYSSASPANTRARSSACCSTSASRAFALRTVSSARDLISSTLSPVCAAVARSRLSASRITAVRSSISWLAETCSGMGFNSSARHLYRDGMSRTAGVTSWSFGRSSASTTNRSLSSSCACGVSTSTIHSPVESAGNACLRA